MKEIIRPGNGGIKIKYNNTCPYKWRCSSVG